MTVSPLGVGIVGCGYVADFYGVTIFNHPELRLVGATDLSPPRAESFAELYGGRVFSSLDDLLSCPEIEIVVDLTPPDAHDEVNRRVVAAGRHLYSEKPLSLSAVDAYALIEAASVAGSAVGVAPCSVLGEPAVTMAAAINRGDIGAPRLVYAELDNGALPLLSSDGWFNARGIPWPTHHEIRTGCTLEHSPYYLTWIVRMFGPVVEAHCSTATVMLDLWEGEADLAPDLSVGLLRTKSGVVVRITTGWAAPSDLSMTVVGTQGVLRVSNAWSYAAPVTLREVRPVSGKDHGYLSPPRLVPFEPTRWARRRGYEDTHDMDPSRGIAELALHLRTGQPLALSPAMHAHVTDVCLRLATGVSGPVDTTHHDLQGARP